MEEIPRLNEAFLNDNFTGMKFVAVNKEENNREQVSTSTPIGSLKSKSIRDRADGVDWLVALFVCNILVTIQFILAVGSYSGEGVSPMHGDFEAQRHWMEITYHLPIEQWYVNGTDNDLQYWGLDYPPVTAYHSCIMGYIAHRINASWVSLHSSRGIETAEHKLFMRISAIVPYLSMYLPAILAFCWTASSKNISKNCVVALSCLYAGLLSMDCGHFQYNSVSLGFFLGSYVALVHDFTLSGSVLFVLSVNYKQMELYHALPIFVFILARNLKRPLISRAFESFLSLLSVALVVLFSFGLIWSPFILHGKDHVLLVLRRVFPFYRGMYEDKVASIWCSFSFILKLNRFLSTDAQILLSTCCVLLASSPSLLILFCRPTTKNFRFSLFLTSLAFFLFSFQVHEKSILLPAVASILLLPEYPSAITFFLHLSNTSMFSLCLKDGNQTMWFLYVAYWVMARGLVSRKEHDKIQLLMDISSVGSLIVCLAEWFVSPPNRLPHIFPLLNAVYSCCHFIGFLLYFHYQMISEEYSKWTKKNS